MEALRFDKSDAKVLGDTLLDDVLKPTWRQHIDRVLAVIKMVGKDCYVVLGEQFYQAVDIVPISEEWSVETDSQRILVMVLLAFFVIASIGVGMYVLFENLTSDLFRPDPEATLMKTTNSSDFEKAKKLANATQVSVATPYTLYTPLGCLYIASEMVLPSINRPDLGVYRRSTVTSQRMMNRLVDPDSAMDSSNLSFAHRHVTKNHTATFMAVLILMLVPLWVHRREYFVGGLVGLTLLLFTMFLIPL